LYDLPPTCAEVTNEWPFTSTSPTRLQSWTRANFHLLLLEKDVSWTGSEQVTGARHIIMSFEVHELVAIKFTVSWDPRLCDLKNVYTIAGTWSIHIQRKFLPWR